MTVPSNILPPLSEEEYAALKADIERRGVQVPIELDEDGEVLDGFHRLQACEELGIAEYPTKVREGLTEEEKLDHALRLNLTRRHLTAEQRAVAALKLLPLERKRAKERYDETVGRPSKSRQKTAAIPEDQKGKAVEAAAKGAHTNPEYVRKAEAIQEAAPELLPYMEMAELKVDTAAALSKVEDPRRRKHLTNEAVAHQWSAAQVRQERKKLESEDARRHQDDDLPAVLVPHGYELRDGDFQSALADIPDDSVDLIFVDPPYAREAIPIYEDLAELAARVLREEGSLIAYAGHYAVPEILPLVSKHLRFWWILAVHLGGKTKRLENKQVTVCWKPMLWFVKGNKRHTDYVQDCVDSAPSEKKHHAWEQSEVEAAYYIRHLTSPGDLVLDPMCGSGTTIIAAAKLSRRAIGVDKDPAAVTSAQTRLNEYFTKQPGP